jgi:GNAT superfamily N-acetyltransferase
MGVRRATPADAEELTRLRSAMYETWGADTSDAGWREANLELFRRRLSADPDFVAFVVDGEEGRLVASGAGWIEQHLPGPQNPTGRRGHIASMSTDPRARRQGLARAVFEALLGWFEEQGVHRIDLRATPMGEPLYRAYGFGEGGGRALTWAATPMAEWTTARET